MWDTTSRTFRLLELLQRNGFMATERLADDLGVTTRTVRRDVARLRDLGYPVDSRLGVDGGYSIAPGAVLPPIHLTTEEALACALALRRWTDDVDGTLAASSLAKVVASLPPRARWIVDAVAAVTVDAPVDALEPIDHPSVDIGLLGDLARTCLVRRRVEFAYTARDGTSTPRRVDPHRLVNTARRWYLVAFDLDADAWRTFRADRISGFAATDLPVRERPLPDPDIQGWVTRRLAVGWQQVTGTVRIHAPIEAVRRWVAPVWGSVEAVSPEVTVVRAGADSYDAIARWLLLVQADVDVIEPDGLRAAFGRVAEQASRAAASDPAPPLPGGPTPEADPPPVTGAV